MKVLLVEDSTVFAQSIMAALTGRNCEVTLKLNGQAAIEALAEQDDEPFDLVVTDFRLPFASGLEVCENTSDDQMVMLWSGTDLTKTVEGKLPAHVLLAKKDVDGLDLLFDLTAPKEEEE